MRKEHKVMVAVQLLALAVVALLLLLSAYGYVTQDITQETRTCETRETDTRENFGRQLLDRLVTHREL